MQKLNEPGIYRRKDGRYHVRATAKDPESGKIREKRRTLTDEQTIQEAITKREQLKSEIRRPPKEKGPQWHTVADYAMDWWKRRRPTLAPSTQATDERILSDWVLPYIGHIEIQKLSRSHIQQYVAQLDAATKSDGSSYSRATRRGRWNIAKQLLLDLKADTNLNRNPVERVKPPQRGGGKTRPTESMTQSQFSEFLDAAKRMRPDRYAEILTMATTGMRPSSMYGLMWPDIDYDGGCIHIRRSSSNGKLNEKTKNGAELEVPLFAELAEELRAHRKEQLRDGGVMLDSGLVFPSTKGTPRRSSSIRKPMYQICDRIDLGLRVGPQMMRRSFNNLLRQAGVSEITLRSIVGHSRPEMTELYSHVDLDEKRDATGVIDALLGS